MTEWVSICFFTQNIVTNQKSRCSQFFFNSHVFVSLFLCSNVHRSEDDHGGGGLHMKNKSIAFYIMRCHIKEIISNVYISPIELCLKRGGKIWSFNTRLCCRHALKWDFNHFRSIFLLSAVYKKYFFECSLNWVSTIHLTRNSFCSIFWITRQVHHNS